MRPSHTDRDQLSSPGPQQAAWAETPEADSSDGSSSGAPGPGSCLHSGSGLDPVPAVIYPHTMLACPGRVIRIRVRVCRTTSSLKSPDEASVFSPDLSTRARAWSGWLPRSPVSLAPQLAA